jgi:hypothetical protein
MQITYIPKENSLKGSQTVGLLESELMLLKGQII